MAVISTAAATTAEAMAGLSPEDQDRLTAVDITAGRMAGTADINRAEEEMEEPDWDSIPPQEFGKIRVRQGWHTNRLLKEIRNRLSFLCGVVAILIWVFVRNNYWHWL